MEKPLEKSKKTSSKFDYFQFFKWLSIGFTITGVGVAIAIALFIYTQKQ